MRLEVSCSIPFRTSTTCLTLLPLAYPTFQFLPVDLVAVCDHNADRREPFAKLFGAEGANVHVALRALRHEQIHHLLELELVVGVQGEREVAELHAGIGTLEIEAVGDLLVGLIDRVLELHRVDFRRDVE